MKAKGTCKGCGRRRLINLLGLCKRCNKDPTSFLSKKDIEAAQAAAAAAAAAAAEQKAEDAAAAEAKRILSKISRPLASAEAYAP